MNQVDYREKVIIFKQNLNKECHTYGWSSAERCATQLYVNNLNLEDENMYLYEEMNRYKNNYETMINSEIKNIINDLTDKVIKNNNQKYSNKFIVKIIKNEN
jgi:hypothetical protein|tara:strand:+ start:303 stop:608 length:306 start_codon:yes stop_codon:yes gene_type:complete